MKRKSKDQRRLLSTVVSSVMSFDTPYAYIETGKSKAFSVATVNSLVSTGELKLYADARPSVDSVFYLVLGDKHQKAMEVSEWCYGDCMSYLDSKNIEYDSGTDLYNMKCAVVENRIGLT